jgi:hypothetical protein
MSRSPESRLTVATLAGGIFAALIGAAPPTALADSSSDQQALGYNGSGLAGYNGSGLAGYNGSDAGRAAKPNVCYEFGAGFAKAAMGPVESVSLSGDRMTVQVLGQTFESVADESLSTGDYVVAAATEEHAGAILYQVGSPYVPGVSAVRIRALASSVDNQFGQVVFGAARVDFTSMLSTYPSLAPDADSVLVFVGTQPVPGGVILAGPDANGAVGC